MCAWVRTRLATVVLAYGLEPVHDVGYELVGFVVAWWDAAHLFGYGLEHVDADGDGDGGVGHCLVQSLHCSAGVLS